MSTVKTSNCFSPLTERQIARYRAFLEQYLQPCPEQRDDLIQEILHVVAEKVRTRGYNEKVIDALMIRTAMNKRQAALEATK